MNICLGCDHAGYDAKRELVRRLGQLKHSVIDLGCDDSNSCHYPDYALKVARHVQREGGRGILLCGSGIGVSMAANRFAHIRAALCRSVEEARLSRQHNDANVLCMGSRINSAEEIWGMTVAWLEEVFEGGRHSDRIELFDSLGTEQ